MEFRAPSTATKQEHHPGTDGFALVGRLHTDALEEHYGPIQARVLHHDHRYRTVHLLDGGSVSRTFAVTLFPLSGVEAPLRLVDDRLRAGGSMGRTFREHGFSVRKNVLHVFVVGLPGWLQDAFQATAFYALARASEFIVRRGDSRPMVYGVVVEIYHPDFRPAVVHANDRLQIAPSFAALERNGVSADQAWRRLACARPFDATDPRYVDALRSTHRQVLAVEEQARHLLLGKAKRMDHRPPVSPACRVLAKALVAAIFPAGELGGETLRFAR